MIHSAFGITISLPVNHDGMQDLSSESFILWRWPSWESDSAGSSQLLLSSTVSTHTQSIKSTASSQMHWAKNKFKPASCSFKECILSLYEPQIFWHICRSTLLYFMFYSIIHFGLTYLTHLWYTALRTDAISSASLNFSLNVFCWENSSLKGLWLLSETIIILK